MNGKGDNTMQVNQGSWCQESWDTGNPGIRARVRDLRKRGHQVITSSMGYQVTRLGSMKMTMIDIRPGSNPDTYGIGRIDIDI